MQHRQGFTLIELLVVVLIIGILASVALPQYQKAVAKTNLSQADVIVDAGKKNVDLYTLSNGYPASGQVFLTGSNGESEFDMPGDCSAGRMCKVGNWNTIVRVTPESAEVIISWNKSGGVFPEGFSFALHKQRGGSTWFVVHSNDSDLNQLFCQWMKGRNIAGQSDVVEECTTYGVTVSSNED